MTTNRHDIQRHYLNRQDAKRTGNNILNRQANLEQFGTARTPREPGAIS
jgi:hypothetical protein